MARLRALVALLCLFATDTSTAQDCNLVANGDFAEYNKGWTFSSQWPAFADYGVDLQGRALIQIVRFENPQKDAKFTMAFDMIALEQGQKYELKLEHSSNQENLPITIRLVDTKGTVYYSKETSSPLNTATFADSFEHIGPSNDSLKLEIKLPTDKFKFYIDNIKIQNSNCLAGTATRKSLNPLLTQSKASTDNNASNSTASKPEAKAYIKPGFANMEISGYARFETVYRHLSQRYHVKSEGVDPLTDNAIMINGVYPDFPFNNGRTTGYREPMLMLEMKVQPIYNTFLKTDFTIDNQLVGNVMDTSIQQARRIEMYRYVNAEVEHIKNWGTLRLKAGGVHFTQFSPLTFYAYEWRDDMFERYPWEWRNNSNEIYQQYYESKSIARDARFANTSVGGFFLEGEKLPRGFSFKALFGKTGNANNGFLTFNSDNYKYVKALRISKNIKGAEVGINFYNQFAWQKNSSNPKDTLSGKDEETIVTANTSYSNKLFSLSAELGFAQYESFNKIPDANTGLIDLKTYKFGPTPIGRLRIESNNLIKNTPISFLGYYIGNGYLNLNSSVLNSTMFGAVQTDATYVSTYPKAITELGQMSANRVSGVFAINPSIKKLKISLGLGLSKEVTADPFTPYISFQHRVASINRSRFWFYRAQAGNFGNLTNFWRRSWEQLYIRDKSIITNRPNFLTIDASLKYKLKFIARDLILTNYTNYNNVYSGTGPSLWGGNNLLSYIFNDVTAFYTLNKTFTLVGQFCIEHAISDGKRLGKSINDLTVNNGINQFGHSYGIGLDIITGARSGLYLRQKWYEHTDKNYVNMLFSDGSIRSDHFKGFESSAEFKIFF